MDGTGDAVDENGDAITDSSGSPLVATDASDSGTNPSNNNSNDPDDQGTPDDPTIFAPPAVPLSEISGFVFEDLDGDGIQGPGEPGIPGVTVILTGTDVLGNPVQVTAQTDANGQYVFAGLYAGTYEVTQIQPDGFDDGIDAGGSTSINAGNDVLSNIQLGFGESVASGTFGELIAGPVNTGATGNPPVFPSLPPILSNLLSNRIDPFLGGPGQIYSGIPINGNGNPLSLDSGRPVSGGYSGDGTGGSYASDPCCDAEFVESTPVETIVTTDDCGACGDVPAQTATEDCGSCGDVIVEGPIIHADAPLDPSGEGVPVEQIPHLPCISKPSFLSRFRNWLAQ